MFFSGNESGRIVTAVYFIKEGSIPLSPNHFSDQVLETVRDRNDLIAVVSDYLSLKKAGQNYTGLCPFHQEKTPSFTVSPGKQIFHCFGCGVGGNVFQFLMKIEGVSFPEALEKLAEKAGVTLPEKGGTRPENPAKKEAEEIYRLNEAAAAYFHDNLMHKPEGKQALAYLKGRGITVETMKVFSIGFALPGYDYLLKAFRGKFPERLLEKSGLVSKKSRSVSSSSGRRSLFDRFRNRILFPIQTLQGKVAGFGGRVLDDSLPKYLNTPETSVFTKRKHLFAINKAKAKGIHSLIIVEGYLDAIQAHQAGVPNVAATLGTAITPDHLHIIRRVAEKVVLNFDPDAAGIRAALRAAPLFIEKGIPASVVSLPPGQDPDLFIQKYGKEAFLQKVEEAETLIDFSISSLVGEPPLKSIEDKKKITKEIFPLIRGLKSHIEQSHYLKRLSAELGIQENALRKDFSNRSDVVGGIGLRKRVQDASPFESSTVQEQPPPLAEKMLTHLLLRGDLEPSALDGKLLTEDFTDERIREILSLYWDAGQFRWHFPGDIDVNQMNERARTLYSGLLIEEIQYDDIKRTGEDCISDLLSKRLQGERDEIQKRIRQAEQGGDITTVASLQRKALDLKKEQSHLTLSH